jgi:hypothetical protein
MNNKKIDFIICVNDIARYGECARYIQELHVPDGYETEIISIQEADSMAAGYNAAMNNSDAKYKVYLHQDVYILNENFISDTLEIFRKNQNVGMLGVIGAATLPDDALCYLAWRFGRVYDYDGQSIGNTNFLNQAGHDDYISAAAIDGMIMMTQYDIPWREDFLDGWDFYDISQSIEMKRHGYEVAVPHQKETWCYHDNGVSKLSKYDFYRKKMMLEYSSYFPGKFDETENARSTEERKRLSEIRDKMVRAIELHMYDDLICLTDKLMRGWWPLDTYIREIMNLMKIYRAEERDTHLHSEWFSLSSWKEMYEYYSQVHRIIIRKGFGRTDERIAELEDLVRAHRISEEAIEIIEKNSLP